MSLRPDLIGTVQDGRPASLSMVTRAAYLGKVGLARPGRLLTYHGRSADFGGARCNAINRAVCLLTFLGHVDIIDRHSQQLIGKENMWLFFFYQAANLALHFSLYYNCFACMRCRSSSIGLKAACQTDKSRVDSHGNLTAAPLCKWVVWSHRNSIHPTNAHCIRCTTRGGKKMTQTRQQLGQFQASKGQRARHSSFLLAARYSYCSRAEDGSCACKVPLLPLRLSADGCTLHRDPQFVRLFLCRQALGSQNGT